ncbi:MAG: Mobile element protein [Proteobacteria bacterium]|nr:Mobile element protein [Pseudomonadota bacterium]
MTKPVSTTKKSRKQHTPEFREEALKLAAHISVTEVARELSLYGSLFDNWLSEYNHERIHSSLNDITHRINERRNH